MLCLRERTKGDSPITHLRVPQYDMAKYGRFKSPPYTLGWDRRLLAFDPATSIMSWENYDGRGYLCGVFRGPLAWGGGEGKEKAKGREVEGDWSVLSILLNEVGIV